MCKYRRISINSDAHSVSRSTKTFRYSGTAVCYANTSYANALTQTNDDASNAKAFVNTESNNNASDAKEAVKLNRALFT